MPCVELDEHTLYYESVGEGPTLIAVAGTGQDHTVWKELRARWSLRWRVVTFDSRDSTPDSLSAGGYGVGDLAGDILALADELQQERFHLVGLSMGGAVAQEAALQTPARVEGLVLAVSWARTADWQPSSMYSGDAIRIARARQLLIGDGAAQPPEALARQIEAGRSHDTLDRLPSLRCPVLVIGASDDDVVPPDQSALLASLIPTARLEILTGCGHQVERDPTFANLVTEFLLRCEIGTY